MIYSGSGSSFELYRGQDPDPTHYLSSIENIKNHLKFYRKAEFTNCLPFSISKYSPTVPVHNPEFTGLKLKINIYLSSLSFFAGSDPCGPGSATLLVRVILRPVGEGKPQNYR